MTPGELKNILINAIKNNKGRTPLNIDIDNKKYTYNGGQRIGNSYLYKYRLASEICEIKDEKQIMLSL